MPTKLPLRNTQDASPNVDLGVIGVGVVYDMVTTFGAAIDTDTVNTVAGGTEILWTQTGGGSTIAWITGRTPAGGFTLTTTDISAWLRESNMNANCGGRFRVYRYTPGAPATLTELGGGPFDDGVEFGTASAEMLWAGNVTDQAFVEDERIVLKLFITNIGTMGGGFTCDVQFNAADATTGDSFLNLAETVAFKAEPVPAGHPAMPRLNYVTHAGQHLGVRSHHRFAKHRPWIPRDAGEVVGYAKLAA